MNKKRKNIANTFIILGVCFILLAVIVVIYNMQLENNAQKSSSVITNEIVKSLDNTKNNNNNKFPYEQYQVNEKIEMPNNNIDGTNYVALLEVETLELKLPIASTWDYAKLNISPCRYTGSAYTKDMVIAGHNYNSHFGRIKDLKIGDKVTVTDMDNNIFKYEVSQKEIVEPTQIDKMVIADEWDLTLFTCDYLGSVRETVRCVEVD